ncbi:MAG: two-component system response regulator [Spirochaetae bacterium HGW-Spirochaetae-1]|jgi:CheY-like chemotaxis protein|nr:MAG: two-component system response regulator [Spirochaetae bacterium HGW-Spirochaetae-1]
MRNRKPILVIEDDRIDAMHVRRAFGECNIANSIIVLGDGEEALLYLHDGKREKPGIMIVDLNMPRMNGVEFLMEVRKDKGLMKIPVVILTTSGDMKDRKACFNLGAAGYMTKPVARKDIYAMIQTLEEYGASGDTCDEE